VPIADLKLANGIFVKEGMYKMASDSLQSLVYVYKDKVAVKEAQITTLQENVANYKKVADLCDVEKASLQAALEKEKKDYKRYRLKTTIVGILGSVLLGIVTALAIR
jgi:Arc/MetJ-type ribon-helix-helix transcriptional regulator